jgi:hypothetical protein
MGVGEKHTALCETIDVGGFGLRMAPETANPVVEVVDGDEEDVGLAGGERRGDREENGTQNEEHRGSVESRAIW